jgi:Tfp pilus assembly protein PilX
MTKPCNQKKNQNSEKGIALFTAIFTVLLITAIGAGMIMLTNTDTSISANFRDEQTAFFAAKAGMEEIRDRFRNGATNSLAASLPAALPGNANAFLYVLNPRNGEADTP